MNYRQNKLCDKGEYFSRHLLPARSRFCQTRVSRRAGEQEGGEGKKSGETSSHLPRLPNCVPAKTSWEGQRPGVKKNQTAVTLSLPYITRLLCLSVSDLASTPAHSLRFLPYFLRPLSCPPAAAPQPKVGADAGSYLDDPETWSKYDPDLFHGLVDLLRSASQPSLSLIEIRISCPGHATTPRWLPTGAWSLMPGGMTLLCEASGVDLVFLDSDNGIEIPSKPVSRKGSSKYVTWQEIKTLWEARVPSSSTSTFAAKSATHLRAASFPSFANGPGRA